MQAQLPPQGTPTKINPQFNSLGPNPALQPGDRLCVKERPEYRQDYRVWIHGEVAQPGTYPITRNTTKLSHVIAKAGGFTADASLRSAELFRKSIAREDEGFEYLKSYKGIVAPHDSANYLVETALRIRKEVVQVDFYRLFVQKDSTADVYLQSEDEIFVPEASRTVYVFGQVLNPGHITYVPGKNASYYIDQAGGYGDRANESAVLVIKRVSGQAVMPSAPPSIARVAAMTGSGSLPRRACPTVATWSTFTHNIMRNQHLLCSGNNGHVPDSSGENKHLVIVRTYISRKQIEAFEFFRLLS